MVISKMDITILTMQAAFKIGFVGIIYMKGKKKITENFFHNFTKNFSQFGRKN